jgi:hypothetical protein
MDIVAYLSASERQNNKVGSEALKMNGDFMKKY